MHWNVGQPYLILNYLEGRVIPVLCIAMMGGGIRIAQISVMKVHGSMLLALRGGGIRF